MTDQIPIWFCVEFLCHFIKIKELKRKIENLIDAELEFMITIIII